MSTLQGFLLARIAEDEAVARSKPDVYACWSGSDSEQDLTSVADIPPGRLLAECEAKRRIIERCAAAAMEPALSPPGLTLAVETLRALALPFADHPDWREAWTR